MNKSGNKWPEGLKLGMQLIQKHGNQIPNFQKWVFFFCRSSSLGGQFVPLSAAAVAAAARFAALPNVSRF